MTLILVVATIMLFLGIDWFVQRKRVPVTAPVSARQSTSRVRTPDGIFFHRSHTWLNIFPSGKVRLGIDDFVQRALVNPTVTLLKKSNETVQKGDPIIELREGNRTLTLRAPIEGKILTANSELVKNPGLMKDYLFSSGWAYTIQPARFTELKQFFVGEETQQWIAQEFRRLRDVLAGVNGELVPVTLQDGGLPAEGLLSSAADETWTRFESEFLTTK